jgi:tetratricopeptide (TPR) repeat protein
MTTEIITKLSGIQEWKVMNTASVMRFKNSEKDIKDIGQELGVTTILLGSVRREANDLRVDVQLVNTEDRFQIWGDIYEQKITGIFEIQSIIAERVVKALEATLSPEEEERLKKRPTDNLEAYNLYLSGRWFWEKRTEEGLKKAIEFFDQAVEKDSNYALAYVGKADSYNMLGEYGYLREKEAYPKARAAAEKALEIDNTLAEAHTSLAWIKCAYDWDWEGAEKEFKRAIELNPNYANAHHWYAIYLMWMTRHDEAIAEIKLALELDPLSIIINRSVGAVFLNSRHYDQAIEALERTSKMDPNFVGTSYRMGIAYREKSMYKEALAEFQKENNEYGIAIVNIKMGNNQKAIELRDHMIAEAKTNNSLSVWIAKLCFSLGEIEKGFGWLHKALEERSGELLGIKYDWAFDSVRSDPRFKEILKKMNLE